MAVEPATECAGAVWGTFHRMMRSVVPDPRKRPSNDLSIQQFRAMLTIKHHEGSSLSELREHMGATISAASKLVDGLVDRGYIRRENAADDRRRLILALTATGREKLQEVDSEILSRLAGKLAVLSQTERSVVMLAMDLLGGVLTASQIDIKPGEAGHKTAAPAVSLFEPDSTKHHPGEER